MRSSCCKADPSLAAAVVKVPVKRATVRSLPAPVALDADDRRLLTQVVGYYHETLKAVAGGAGVSACAWPGSPGADRPLQAGIRQPHAGPAPARKSRWPARTSARGCRSWACSARAVTNTSMVRWWCRCSMRAANVTEMYGRKITRRSAQRHAAAPVPAGTASGRVERRGSDRQQEVILCEALIDAMTFWCAGFRNVTACLRRRRLYGRSCRCVQAA